MGTTYTKCGLASNSAMLSLASTPTPLRAAAVVWASQALPITRKAIAARAITRWPAAGSQMIDGS